MAHAVWADLTNLAYASFRAIAAGSNPYSHHSEYALFQKALDELTSVNPLYSNEFPDRHRRWYVLDQAHYDRLQQVARAHGLRPDQVATAVVLHYLDQNPRLDGSNPGPNTWAVRPNTGRASAAGIGIEGGGTPERRTVSGSPSRRQRKQGMVRHSHSNGGTAYDDGGRDRKGV